MTNARQHEVLRGYRAEAGEEGDLEAADRGDQLSQAAAAATAEAKAAEDKKAADDKAAEDKKTADEAAKKTEDEKRAAEKKKRDESVTIPKERFDQAVAKERARAEAAEKQAKELQDKLTDRATAVDVAKVQGELEALEEQLDKALADNNPEEKKRLRREIREKQDRLIDVRADAKAAAATAVAVEQIRYDSAVSLMEAEYPFLNPDLEETYSEELAGSLLDLKAAYEAAGMGSAGALKKALKTLKPQLDGKKGKPAEAEEKAKAAAEAKAKAEAEEAKRREEAVKKGQEAKDGQPPADPAASGKVDVKGSEIKVGGLSDEAFAKLPEAELKRLRGD